MIQIIINDISNKVRATLLTGLNTALTGAITATDTVLEAFGKLQNQLNGKENTITTLPISKGGTNSGTALNNNRIMRSSGGAITEAPAITVNRALVSDANGIPIASSVTDTTLGYLDVTSSVQTQLNDAKPYLIDFTKTTSTGSAFSNVIVRSYLIPANTFKTGDVIKIRLRVSRPSSQTGTSSYAYMNSNDGINYSVFGLIPAISNTSRGFASYRHLEVVGAINNTEVLSPAAQSITDDISVPTGFPYTTITIDWTKNAYIGFRLSQATTTDSSTIESVIIEKIRI